MSKDTLKKEVLSKKIDTTIRQNIEAQAMVDFYKAQAEEEKDKKVSSTYLMKASQVEESVKFNEKYIEFISASLLDDAKA